MRVTRRLDRFQQRHPVLGFPIAVIYKFVEDQGPYLAALITYYGFLSLFPLLLLLASVLGFVLQDDPEPAGADPRLDAEPVPDHRPAARASPRACGAAPSPSSSAGSSPSTARSAWPRRCRTP